jgi:hypothetical protein
VLRGSTIDRVWHQRKTLGGLVNGIVFHRTVRLFETGEITAADQAKLTGHECVEIRGTSVGKP